MFFWPIYRYESQASAQLYLTKGDYYYVETLFKEQHSNDHLEVALKAPDGKFYAPIPSQFLWTALPPPKSKLRVFLSHVHIQIASM